MARKLENGWSGSCDQNVLPDMIPALNRDHLATPAGLLLNELTFTNNYRESVAIDVGERV